jgi:hypothetical protein
MMARHKHKPKPSKDHNGRIAAGIVLFLLLLAALIYVEWPVPKITTPLAEIPLLIPLPPTEPIEAPVTVAPTPEVESPPMLAAPEQEHTQAPTAPEPTRVPDPPAAPSPSAPAAEITPAAPERRASASDRHHARQVRPRKHNPHQQPSYWLADPCSTWQRYADWCTADGAHPGMPAH